MDTSTIIAIVAAVVCLAAFLYALTVWRVKAARVDAAEAAVGTWQEQTKRLQAVIADKESKLVEVQKLATSCMSTEQLADELNRVFGSAAPGSSPAGHTPANPR